MNWMEDKNQLNTREWTKEIMGLREMNVNDAGNENEKSE